MHACNKPSSQIRGYSLKFGFKLALLYGPIQQIGRSCTEYSVVAMIHVTGPSEDRVLMHANKNNALCQIVAFKFYSIVEKPNVQKPRKFFDFGVQNGELCNIFGAIF